MHNPASVPENDTHKILRDLTYKTDHLISDWRLDLTIINKKERTCKIVDFLVLADHRIKLKEREKKDKNLDLTRELKKLWNMKVTILPIDWCFSYSHQMIIKGTGGLGNKKTSGDHSNYNIVEDSQNTEKSPGDLRLAVTQTPVKDHQLTLTRKTRIGVNNNNNNEEEKKKTCRIGKFAVPIDDRVK